MYRDSLPSSRGGLSRGDVKQFFIAARLTAADGHVISGASLFFLHKHSAHFSIAAQRGADTMARGRYTADIYAAERG